MLQSLGIRREDKNKWERRTPLIPSHVKELVEESGLNITLQPSSIRIFSEEDYRSAGARITESLEACDIILGIKEIPPELLRPGKAYVFFSHTIKGQDYNMPLLKRLMDLGCTLIDYEKIEDSSGGRLVFFGIQAGQAGMIETLAALGKRLEAEGLDNPFAAIRQPFRYASLVEAKEAVREVGARILSEGLPQSCLPLICGFAGYGRVSQGAQEIFDLLPFETIRPEDLNEFMDQGAFPSRRLAKVVFKEEHMVRPRGKQPFRLKDYYDNPEKYEPVFASYLPHLSVLVNAIFWSPRYPRFVSREDLASLWNGPSPPRLRVIGDITCDIDGSMGCTLKATEPDQPTYVYDPITRKIHPGVEGRGVVVMAVDNLPCEIALESSIAFSESLMPFIHPLATADFSKPLDESGLPDEIKRATILYKGTLTEPFAYMKQYIQSL
jgi:alanine dehydrogenase